MGYERRASQDLCEPTSTYPCVPASNSLIHPHSIPYRSLWKESTPPERTRTNISFQNTKSVAGEQNPLQDCSAKADTKGVLCSQTPVAQYQTTCVHTHIRVTCSLTYVACASFQSRIQAYISRCSSAQTHRYTAFSVHTIHWVFRDVVLEDVGCQNASLNPLTHVSFRWEVPTPSVVMVNQL